MAHASRVPRSRAPGLTAAVCALVLLLPTSAPPRQSTLDWVPGLVLWAWERPEDLRGLAGDTAVAFLAQTITIDARGVEVSPRRQPLRISPGTPLIAVTRVETGSSDHPALTGDLAAGVAHDIARTATVPGVIAVQVGPRRPAATLPDRLRGRVAGAAFARAVLLRRDDLGLAVAPHLRALSPHLARDLDSYSNASDAEARHRAGVMLLLRTPGMHLSVQGIDDNVTYLLREPVRQFDHIFRRNWWCRVDAGVETTFATASPDTATIALLYEGKDVPFPEFLAPAERAATGDELKQLSALAPAPDYLGSDALAWARATPTDTGAAEALALVVEGGRWTCEGAKNAALSRRAFQTLHRLFPQSKGAKQTKYWYR